VDSLSAAKMGLKAKNGSFGKLYGQIPMTDGMVEEMKAKPFVLTVIKEMEQPGAAYYYPDELRNRMDTRHVRTLMDS